MKVPINALTCTQKETLVQRTEAEGGNNSIPARIRKRNEHVMEVNDNTAIYAGQYLEDNVGNLKIFILKSGRLICLKY